MVRKIFTVFLQMILSFGFAVSMIAEAQANKRLENPKWSESRHSFFQTQSDLNSLLAEASQPEYTVRRIEIEGNTFTSYQALSRRFAFQEGDVFTMAKLNRSLLSLNRMRNLKFARLGNIWLDRKNKIVDLLFVVQEKPRVK